MKKLKEKTTVISIRVAEKNKDEIENQIKMIAFCYSLIDEFGENTINGNAVKLVIKNKNHVQIIKDFGEHVFKDSTKLTIQLLSKSALKKLQYFYDKLINN